MNGVTAELSPLYSITATIEEAQNYYINGTVKPSESYSETYEIPSSFDDITIPTKNKYLTDDIVIKKVPVSTTANVSGGYTLNIGG